VNEWEWQLLEERQPLESVAVDGVEIRKGDLVKLRPRQGGDIFDLALAGQTAIVEALEQDYEGKVHLAVVLEDDPGKDLGMLRQPGHRFFFSPEEVESLGGQAAVADAVRTVAPKILVAGIGNIFMGDDGFGVEVVRRLSTVDFPGNVRVRDFGIRGYDLAYALLDGPEVTILVDATARGGEPGTLYVIEPDVSSLDQGPATLDAHSMDPASVLRLARSMGTVSGRILLVACEPSTLGGDEGQMGLSDTVQHAVEGGAALVRKLIHKILSGHEFEEAKAG